MLGLEVYPVVVKKLQKELEIQSFTTVGSFNPPNKQIQNAHIRKMWLKSIYKGKKMSNMSGRPAYCRGYHRRKRRVLK